MKVWEISAFGLDHLALTERPMPQPSGTQVVVKVYAVSLNYRDLLTVSGRYNPKMALPRIPCSDGAGEVVAIGEKVTRVKIRQRVAGIFMQNWIDGPPEAAKQRGALGGDIDGTLAEFVLVDENGLVEIPAHLSWEEAATLPCAAVTAWNAVVHAGQTKAGDTVVIQGTGGVSIFALQFAKMLGARVLGTSSSDEKLARAGKLGLDAGLNYKRQEDWAKWVVEQTGGRGADLVIEVGGAGTFGQSVRAIRVGGRIAQIGVLAESPHPIEIRSLLHKQAHLHGIYVGSRADFEEMNRAIALNKLQPQVDQRFSFDDAPKALALMEKASHFGKIVIRLTT
ncbi:NADPH:quinone reductase-like Zn-dependent oxidoreductase [Silvibacterium bohemicum]|uniref:NADPH:quinone reductase-like Zn-dependent oxidoreductase n=1 Tax=Silvibacterium bohemicum TaxID=1577686 RepID=A0A841JMF0_9BACT|nr:NAD(P)-dependent alcohol dehydrogenase [Silvibacterium bohemicum]MBB6142300.1 NADPH:quinone reductase-like Zn-dependent oxidoreductase [Silvibacterium bohemicum]